MTSIKPTDQHFHESNLIEGYNDAEFDTQQQVAWDHLSKVSRLTPSDVMKVQKILTLKQTDLQPNQRGHWRDEQVYVGGHTPPAPALIPAKMAEWLEAMQYPENIDPKAAHVWFENIHPFIDGNGRTGRQLMWWHEVKLGQEPTLIKASERQEYYKWFKEA